MVYSIINKVRKHINKNADILLLVGIVIFLIIICVYFKGGSNNSNPNNNPYNNPNSRIVSNQDNTNISNTNEGFENKFEELFKKNNNVELSNLDILNQIKTSMSMIDKLLLNKDSEIINDVQQRVNPSINKNVNPNKFQFVNISGIESFSGLPFMNQNLNSLPLELNIKDNMPVEMQLKRMKIVLQELKRRAENGELNNNNINNNRKIEKFDDMKANKILKEISNLLHDISHNKNVSKHITQEEDNTYTIEEEIIIRNNKNQEDRKRDKDLAENVYIESVESEGLNDIYHPRIQII